MGGGADGFRSTEFVSHAAIEITEGALAVVQRLCRHARRGRSPAVHFPRTDVVIAKAPSSSDPLQHVYLPEPGETMDALYERVLGYWIDENGE